MNNPNPFIPQGSLLEQKNKKQARLKMAVLAIFGSTILLVGPLLLNGGCRRTESTDTDQPKAESLADTNPVSPGPSTGMGMPSTNPLGMSNPVIGLASNPVVPPPPPPPPVPLASEYTAVKGDTMDGIAKKYHVSTKALLAANPDIVPTKLAPGKKVKIPEGGSASAPAAGSAVADSGATYTVKSGDTLTSIASHNSTTVNALKEANGLKNSAIKVGQKLKLPGKSATAASTSPADTLPPAPTTASNLAPGGSTMQ